MIGGVRTAYITHGTPRVEFVQSMFEMHAYEFSTDDCHLSHPVPICHVGPYIDQNRNKVVMEFLLDQDNKALLSVDHDVCVPHDLIRRLVAHLDKADVLAVDMPMKVGPSSGFVKGSKPGHYRMVEPAEGVDFMEVDAVATSTVLIKRWVFDEITKKYGRGMWFARNWVWDDNEDAFVDIGEDFCFSERAVAVGAKLGLVLGVNCIHVKPARLKAKR